MLEALWGQSPAAGRESRLESVDSDSTSGNGRKGAKGENMMEKGLMSAFNTG